MSGSRIRTPDRQNDILLPIKRLYQFVYTDKRISINNERKECLRSYGPPKVKQIADSISDEAGSTYSLCTVYNCTNCGTSIAKYVKTQRKSSQYVPTATNISLNTVYLQNISLS